MDQEAYKCKYCGAFFVSKSAFTEHKRRNHWDEMSHASDVTSTISEISASRAPPAPPAKTRTSRISRAPTNARNLPPPTARAGPSSSPKDKSPRKLRSPRKPEETPKSPPPAKVAKTAKKINPKNMPANIGKKKKGPNGEEVPGEWLNNPKFKGA